MQGTYNFDNPFGPPFVQLPDQAFAAVVTQPYNPARDPATGFVVGYTVQRYQANGTAIAAPLGRNWFVTSCYEITGNIALPVGTVCYCFLDESRLGYVLVPTGSSAAPSSSYWPFLNGQIYPALTPAFTLLQPATYPNPASVFLTAPGTWLVLATLTGSFKATSFMSSDGGTINAVLWDVSSGTTVPPLPALPYVRVCFTDQTDFYASGTVTLMAPYTVTGLTQVGIKAQVVNVSTFAPFDGPSVSNVSMSATYVNSAPVVFSPE